MKKLISIFLIVGLCVAAVFAKNSDESFSSENKGVIGKVVDGFAESTRTINEINKENIAAIKADSKANFEAAAAPNSGLVKFKEAKGFGNKVSTIFSSLKEGAEISSAKEQERREEIQSFDSYKAILGSQRASGRHAINY